MKGKIISKKGLVIAVINKKRSGKWLVAFSLAATMVCTSFVGQIWATGEENTPTYNTQNNLLMDNADYWTQNAGYSDYFYRDDDGNFIMEWNQESEYGGLIEVPYLTKDFTISGKITMGELKGQDWNGPRFIVGYEDDLHFNIINFCKNGDVEVATRDPDAGWISEKKVNAGPKLAEGTEFNFKIDRNDHHVTVVIDDKVVLECDIPEANDFLIDGMDNNIGMYSSDCTFTVSNFVVYDDNAVIPTPTPEITQKPATPTPGKSPTKAPAATATNAPSDKDGGNGWLIPTIIGAVVLVAVVVVVIVVVNKKKKQ